jgi:hypothetical protein
MTTCHRTFLESRCRERGYTLDEVMPCVVAQDGDSWTIDTSSPFYPAAPKPGHEPPEPPRSKGPGTELKKLLAKIGITSTPSCSCNARARLMDENEAREPGWCEANLDEIVGWLREEATKRGLPFIDLAGRMLVKRAIANARKAEAG